MLLLYKNGYSAGKYIRIEKQIEKTKDRYYDILEESEAGWHNNITDGTRTFRPGSEGAVLVPELKVVSDNIFVKTKSNALTSEPFSEFIKGKGIAGFHVIGADATACVKSTCFNMTKAGCTVYVFPDCVTSCDLKKYPKCLPAMRVKDARSGHSETNHKTDKQQE